MGTRVFSKTFVYDAAERALKTAAQSILLMTGASEAGPFNLFELDAGRLAGSALGGAVLSILFSIVSAPIGGNGTASVVAAPPGPVATEG